MAYHNQALLATPKESNVNSPGSKRSGDPGYVRPQQIDPEGVAQPAP
jgi:hypothetical protein